MLIVNALSESRGIDDSHGNTGAILFELDVVLLDSYGVFLVCPGHRVGDGIGVERRVEIFRILVQSRCAVGKEGLVNERVDESCSTAAGGACPSAPCISASHWSSINSDESISGQAEGVDQRST